MFFRGINRTQYNTQVVSIMASGYVECTDGSMSIEIYPQSLPDSDFNGKITVQRTGTNEALPDPACVTEISEPGVWNRDLNRFRSVYSTRDGVGNPCRDGLQLTPTEVSNNSNFL